MYEEYYRYFYNNNYLMHYGVIGQRKGIRKYQYPDGSLTPEGRRHYGLKDSYSNRTSRSRGRHAVDALDALYKFKKENNKKDTDRLIKSLNKELGKVKLSDIEKGMKRDEQSRIMKYMLASGLTSASVGAIMAGPVGAAVGGSAGVIGGGVAATPKTLITRKHRKDSMVKLM